LCNIEQFWEQVQKGRPRVGVCQRSFDPFSLVEHAQKLYASGSLISAAITHQVDPDLLAIVETSQACSPK